MKILQLVSQITKPLIMPHWTLDLLLSVPRIFCGYFLAVNFGASKFGLPWSPPENGLGFFEVAFWFPNDVAQFGGIFAMAPVFFAWMAAFAEAVGGLLLMAGLQTRIASFLIICTMLVAMFLQHAGKDLWMQLPAMGFLFTAIFTIVLGSGRFGIDYLLTKNL
jgi:putative oxidoreductase